MQAVGAVLPTLQFVADESRGALPAASGWPGGMQAAMASPTSHSQRAAPISWMPIAGMRSGTVKGLRFFGLPASSISAMFSLSGKDMMMRRAGDAVNVAFGSSSTCLSQTARHPSKPWKPDRRDDWKPLTKGRRESPESEKRDTRCSFRYT